MSDRTIGFAVLLGAIVAEVGGTIALRLSHGFTRPLAAAVCIAGYLLALGGLAYASKTVPLSISYSMWAGLGTVGALVASRLLFGEQLTAGQTAGAALVVVGVVLMHALGPRAAV